jgi:AraC family transcriptional regulator
MSSSLLSPAPALEGPNGLLLVSSPPDISQHSGRVGWAGAFFTELVSAPSGTVDHLHTRYCLVRSCAPLETRNLDSHWTARGPDLQLWRPGERLRGEWRGPARCQFLFISQERAEQCAHRLSERPLAAPKVRRSVARILSALSEDLRDGSPAGALVGDTLITGLLCHIRGQDSVGTVTLSALAHRRLIDYVEAHLNQALSLSALAALAGLGERQFLRAFRASVGESPHQYLLRRRVVRAKALIASAIPLAHVSQECGFADQSQLTRIFVRYMGVTPGRYRRLSR